MKTSISVLGHIGLIQAVTDIDSANFSYLKKQDKGKKDDFSLMSTVSNWFNGDSEEAVNEKRRLNFNTQYQILDYTYGILADYQYNTYYNYNYGDLYLTATGENYNYNTEIYTYYSTTTTNSVTYTIDYIPAIVNTYTLYTPADYKPTNKNPSKNYYKSTYVAPPPKPKAKDGEKCVSSYGDCASRCCARNIPVMPMEGQEDLYKVRPQFYNE